MRSIFTSFINLARIYCLFNIIIWQIRKIGQVVEDFILYISICNKNRKFSANFWFWRMDHSQNASFSLLFCNKQASQRRMDDVIVVILCRLNLTSASGALWRSPQPPPPPPPPPHLAILWNRQNRLWKWPGFLECQSIPDNVRWRMISLAANSMEFTCSIRTLVAQTNQYY